MVSMFPFKSFTSSITSSSQIKKYVDKYFSIGLNITLEPSISKLIQFNPQIVNVYAIKIWMGSTQEGYPAASQLQFILRVLFNEAENYCSYMFVEFFSNIDQRSIMFCEHNFKYPRDPDYLILPIKGYRSYAKDPSIFLMMIQASKQEREALREMMIADGISIPSSCSKVDQAALKKLMSIKQYLNRHYYFRHMMFKNIRWELTRDVRAYEAWFKNKKWLKYVNRRMIRHKPYCLHDGKAYYHHKPRQDIIYRDPNYKRCYPYGVPEYCNKWSENYTFRVFSDGDKKCDDICCINIGKLDRIYHLNSAKRELIARIVAKDYGSFYVERVNRVLFITRNPHLFMDLIQTGEKEEICRFIIEDEGLSSSSSSPPLPCKNTYKPNSLQAMCVNQFVNSFLDINRMGYWTVACLRRTINTNPNIPHFLKRQIINEVQRNLMIRSWERAVADETTTELLFQTHHRPRDEIHWQIG